MKLSLDCVVSSQHADTSRLASLAYLISKGNKTWHDQPLEEYVCHEFGISPQLDYPLAAVAASADGLNVGADYWLRADPVHLLMQRDSLSLVEPVPFPLDSLHMQALISSLNAHFQQALEMTFVQGISGACYLRLANSPQIKTSVPAIAVGKNMFHYMPQGDSSAQWRAYLNELQMLLYAHPVNAERESDGLPAINSIWLSGGGVMPKRTHGEKGVSVMVADHPFYRGLAQYMDISCENMRTSLDDMLSSNICPHMRIACSSEMMSDDASFQSLINALKTHKVNRLVINLGYYERTMTVTVSRLDLFKFWRKIKPLSEVLS